MTRETLSSHFKAGASQVEITPTAGVHLAGSVGVFRPARSVADPLFARAVVFEAGGRRICFLGLDVTIITEEYTKRIRSAAARRWAIDHDAVMVHATHTHSAPAIGHFLLDRDFPTLPARFEFLRGGNGAYSDWATDRAVEAIGRAIDALQPVQVGFDSAVKDGLAFNRRGVTRDGSAIMPWLYTHWDKPLGPTNIRYIEGPTDPEVGVLCACTEDMRIHAMLLHFTCHPVNMFVRATNAVAADWPGAWAEYLCSYLGEEGAALILNGCSGNINPWPAFEANFTPDHRRMGRALSDATRDVIEHMNFQDQGVIDWRLAHVSLPVREPEPEQLAQAQRILAEHPTLPEDDRSSGCTVRDWTWAASLVSVDLMRQRSPILEYEIQVFRIGDCAFVGLPGEPFVEGQLAIKIASPAAQTYVASCCSHFVGYVPTPEALTRGGHEVDTSYWAKLVPESLERIVHQATALLKEIFT